ncbi:hypothetical protein NHJ13734_007990 [Beauveria thailandica]
MSEIQSNRPQSRDSKNPIEEPEVTKFQELLSYDNQDGVRIAEAVALSWSKTSLTGSLRHFQVASGYINNTFNVVSGIELFLVGILIRWSGRYKWVLMWGIPLYILEIGLLILFRQPNHSLGYIIMCQMLMSLGRGAIIGGQQVSVVATVSHDEVASAMAVLSLIATIGGAIGNRISSGIWTNTLPDKLQQLLPDSVKDLWQDIFMTTWKFS